MRVRVILGAIARTEETGLKLYRVGDELEVTKEELNVWSARVEEVTDSQTADNSVSKPEQIYALLEKPVHEALSVLDILSTEEDVKLATDFEVSHKNRATVLRALADLLEEE